MGRQGGVGRPEQGGNGREFVAQFSRPRAGDEQPELVPQRQSLERGGAPRRLEQAGEGDLSVFATGLTAFLLGVEHVGPIFVARWGRAKFWWAAEPDLLMVHREARHG